MQHQPFKGNNFLFENYKLHPITIVYCIIISCLQKVDIYDRRTKRMAAVPSADEADGDVDMDNFMVLDSVGSGDGLSS